MRDEQIAAFDSLAEETEKIMTLWGTMQEAADRAAAVPEEATALRELILQAAERLESKAGDLFQQAETYTAWAEKQNAELAAVSTKMLPKAVQAWRLAFARLAVQHFFDELRRHLQLSDAAAGRAAALVETVFPLEQKSRGTALLEIGLRCGITAPELADKLTQRAFTLVPNLLKDKGGHLKGFIYEPDEHPQREFHRCPVCGGTGDAYRAACSCQINSYEPMFRPSKLWMRCQSCGTLYTRWFPEEFLTLGQRPHLIRPRDGYIAVQAANSTLLRTWSDILNSATALSDTGGNSLLEVGVGNGALIAVALEMGFHVTAVEIIERIAQETADLLHCPILCGDFLKMDEAQRFDIITMGDVLEHLQEPAEGLRKAHRLLRDGGVLWLSTPNYESAFSQLHKAEDPMWREPFHITYFSRESLMRLVEQVGFRVMRYSVSNHYNGSMELLLQAK